VDVRWTRIEEVVIMDWLSGETSPEAAIIFNASSLPNPARDAPASWRRYNSCDRLEDSNGE